MNHDQVKAIKAKGKRVKFSMTLKDAQEIQDILNDRALRFREDEFKDAYEKAKIKQLARLSGNLGKSINRSRQ